MPSGFVISLLVHIAAFMLAGLLVVFNVLQKEEKRFVPPAPVDRPKIKLKKPKVKVKKDARPKSTSRIVTKVQKATMPDVQLPEMSGMGNGFGGDGFAGFEIVPDLSKISAFGDIQSVGSDFEGTFYDFNRTRNGHDNVIDTDVFEAELIKFDRIGWKNSVLNKYYRAPKKLYATAIALPFMNSVMAPAVFDEPDGQGRCWIVHYKGKLVHKDGIRFRFVGDADNKLTVRVSGKVVLDATRSGQPQIAEKWLPSSADHRKWWMGHDYAAVGDLIELEPGVPLDMEVIIGETPGGGFHAMLYVMEEGVEYEKNSLGSPILPIFKTAPLSRDLQDLIHRGMQVDGGCLTGDPVFNDYFSGSEEPNAVEKSPTDDKTLAVESVEMDAPEAGGMRSWTSRTGKVIEGEYMALIGGNVVLKTIRGKQKKIALDLLSDEDVRYVSLSNPPRLELDLGKKTQSRRLKYDASHLIGILEYTFTAKVESSTMKYNHPLRVDYWAIGSEIGGNKYILLDQGSDSFIPSEQPKGNYEFSGKTVDLYDYVLASHRQRRGERYEGFLITVTDERGKIIAHRSTPTWLYKNLDKLKQLKPGNFMDDNCTRVWPTQLKIKPRG